VRRCSTDYQGDRVVHDCLAIHPAKEENLFASAARYRKGCHSGEKDAGNLKKETL